MLQPFSELPQEIQLQNIIRGWTALCLETGAHLDRCSGRPKGGNAPKYVLILPNRSIEERGGLFASYDWDYPTGRKFIRAWSDEEAIEEANQKLKKMLTERQASQNPTVTPLEPTPNPAFWQALEAYLNARIIEQVTDQSEPELDELLYKDHPVNEQPEERSWYIEEYLVEPEEELTF